MPEFPCCAGGEMEPYEPRPEAAMNLYERLTDERWGNCGCCAPAPTCGSNLRSPSFQTILNHTYAPLCNRFCTSTFQQDQWRDGQFSQETKKLKDWIKDYKTISWDRPERLRPWDGDHAEFQDSPCKKYREYIKDKKKHAHDHGIGDCLRPPLVNGIAQDCRPKIICENTKALEALNRQYMGPFPTSVVEGLPEALGEHPLWTLHRSADALEKFSGKFYPEERGLARVCNPVGGSFLVSAPFRCNPVYRCCEPVTSTYAGHVPGEALTFGENRSRTTRNALKYMTYRI